VTALAPVITSVLPLIGPPGFPTARYVERLTHPYMAENSRRGREFRYQACRMNPIMFALYYLKDHLELTDGNGGKQYALSEFHVDIASSARRWASPNLGPKEVRDAWIAPRYAAKSTWLFLILSLWALAYGHRKFVVVYGDVEEMAELHLKSLRLELANNDRLRRDFPRLCEPATDRGRKVLDNAGGYLAANGHAIMVKGMNSATLGVKLGKRRPDALFFDDIEPVESKYSADMKDKRLVSLIDAILPCSFEAVVQIVGTTVMHSSIIHNMIEGEPWVAAERIEVHHYTGILADLVTGEERSMWPAKWSYEFLCAERLANPRGYSKNFDNNPINADGTYWRPEHFTYGTFATDERILVVDPTGKSGKKNDETGIAKLGFSRVLQRMLVEDVIGVRLEPDQLCTRIGTTCRLHGIRLGLVDITNGGTWILKALERDVPFVRWHGVHISRGKPDRFAELLDRYLQRPTQVAHARPIPALESVMCAYPKVAHDDVVDVVELGSTYFFEGLAKVGK
jgi:hypothetical protein